MDILIPLIFVAVFYLLPELLKKGKGNETEYEYPEIPERPKAPTMQLPKQSQPKTTAPAEYEYYMPPLKIAQQEVFKTVPPAHKKTDVPPLPPAATTTPAASGAAYWQGSLSPQLLANAVVLSEIILPPRAYRPFGRGDIGRNRR